MFVYNDIPQQPRLVEARLTGKTFNDTDIRGLELLRARRSLAYLKQRVGNDLMLQLLAQDLDASTQAVQAWTEASKGQWQSGALEMSVPGPRAQYFEDWFMGNMKDQHEALFRAGHPDHFMNHPTGPGHAEVIENVGEDDLPWHIFLDFTDTDFAYPTAWDASYANSFGVIINNREGKRIGSAMHELRDGSDGLEVKLTVHLPAAAPQALVDGHLRHFAIEFRNWTELAARDAT